MAISEGTNTFMNEVEKKYMGANPIMKLINWIQHRAFLNKVRHWSPSIGVLWMFSDFIKIAERDYFYDNNRKGILFSSSSYSYGENGFEINDKINEVTLRVKIYSDDQRVVMEIKRTNGSNLLTTHTFENNEFAYEKDTYDEVLIDNAIGIMNLHMIYLIQYCWERKGNYDNYKKLLRDLNRSKKK